MGTTRKAYVHPDDIRAVLARMIDAVIEEFEVADDRGGTGTWCISVDGDRVNAAWFRKAVGRKAEVTVERF